MNVVLIMMDGSVRNAWDAQCGLYIRTQECSRVPNNYGFGVLVEREYKYELGSCDYCGYRVYHQISPRAE